MKKAGKPQGKKKRTKEKKKQQKQANRILYLCYVCLIWGILLFLGEAGKFSYHPLLVFGSGLLFSGALWFGWTSSPAERAGRKNRKVNAVLLLIVFCALYFFFRRKMLDEQFHTMLLCLTKMEDSQEDFTLLYSGLAFLLSLACFFLVFVLKKGWIFYGITLPILFLGPMFGYHLSWFGFFLLVVFHIGNGICHAVYWKWNDEPKERNSRAAVLEKGIFAAVLAVLFSFFLACLIPKGNRKEWMMDSVEFAHTWRRSVDGGNAALEGPSGKISRGNYYSSGSLELEISISNPPKERMYLKSFVGGSYQGDGWAEADERGFSQVFADQQGENGPSLPPAYFNWRDFQLIHYGKMEDWKKTEDYLWPGQTYQNWSGMQEMNLHPLNRLQRTFFAPYLSAYVSRNPGDSYRFFLFSREDYEEYRQRMNEKSLQWFDQMEEPYREYADQHYLEVPEEKLPRLLALCREHPLEDPEEITDFIRRTLAEYASYSQLPGFMPYGTDIAEYFLFDGGEGYCQHFATAAVLMYRMFGIPARYAAGYMAEPGDFYLGRDGLYHANLTDQRAHAWAEIYLGGPGWIPIEVTPASGEGNGQGTAGRRTGEKDKEREASEREKSFFNREKWFGETNEEETSGEIGEREENFPEGIRDEEGIESIEDLFGENAEEFWKSERDLQDDRGPVQEDAGDSADSAEGGAEDLKEGSFTLNLNLLFRLTGMCVLILLLFAAAVWLEEKGKRKKLNGLGADEAYQKIVELLHLGGYLTEFDGTEPEFAEAAAKACRQIAGMEKNRGKNREKEALSREEISRIKSYAFQTAYGREISSDKERKRVIEAYGQIAAALIKSVSGIKRLKLAVQTAFLVWKEQPGRGRY